VIRVMVRIRVKARVRVTVPYGYPIWIFVRTRTYYNCLKYASPLRLRALRSAVCKYYRLATAVSQNKPNY